MEALNMLAAFVVVLAGIWLIGLAAAAFARPESVRRFFAGFASSVSTHFLEMFLRLVVGAAFVIHSPQMRFPVIFAIFGWMLILTTAVLIVVPWKLHKRFADRSLPLATRRMTLFGLVSLVAGVFILSAFILGP